MRRRPRRRAPVATCAPCSTTCRRRARRRSGRRARSLPGTCQTSGAVAGEGVLALAARVRGSITYGNYRAPGRYSNWKKQPLSGTVALTGRRLVVWAGGAKRVDVPFDHPMRSTVEMSVDRPGRLCIALHPHDQADWSGRIELRFQTPEANTIVELWGSGGRF